MMRYPHTLGDEKGPWISFEFACVGLESYCIIKLLSFVSVIPPSYAVIAIDIDLRFLSRPYKTEIYCQPG